MNEDTTITGYYLRFWLGHWALVAIGAVGISTVLAMVVVTAAAALQFDLGRETAVFWGAFPFVAWRLHRLLRDDDRRVTS